MNIFIAPWFWFWFCTSIEVGIGCFVLDDYKTLTALILSQGAFIGGWISAPRLHLDRNVFLIARAQEAFAKWLLIGGMLSFLVVAFFFGLPIFADDPTLSRLNQRSYIPIILYLEYTAPLVLGYAVLSRIQGRSAGFAIFSFIFYLSLSTIFAVRYLFLESFVFIFALLFHVQPIKRVLKWLLLGLVFAVVFFGLVQFLREAQGSLFYITLFSRFFLINYKIFSLNVFSPPSLDHLTYLNPLISLLGGDSYNLGFVIFDQIEPHATVQGYAPVSILGEAFINVDGNLPLAAILIFCVGFALSLYTTTLMSNLQGGSRLLFNSFLCMEATRLVEHSLFGVVLAVTACYLLLKASQPYRNARPLHILASGQPR